MFDPRTYKAGRFKIKVIYIDFLYFQVNDPHWAKKRKSSWLAWPGTIKYTRERTVERKGEENENEKEDEENEPDGKDRGRKGVNEIKINALPYSV